MTTNNIFGNDILSAELNTSLVPELGNENISLGITPQQSSYTDPLNQELSLIEQEIVLDKPENSFEQKSSNNNSSSIDNISLFNIDPLIGGDVSRFQVNNINASNASFAPPQNELEFQGGFGDYDSGNDVTFEVKNDRGIVVETYALSGEGQATLYRDEDKAYVFFSGTDKSTNVNISAKSNIQFGNYIGDSLKIETTGSIEGGDIVLNDPDETGLVLRSGIEGLEENLEVLGYDAIHLGAGLAQGINNKGDVIVRGYGASLPFIYSDREINYLGSDNSITPNGINDSGQVVGSFISSDNNTHAFVYSGGSISDLGVLPGAETYETPSWSGLGEVPYDFARSFGNAINNNGQIVGTASSKFAWGFDQFRWRAFISNGGSMTDLQSGLNGLFGLEADFVENNDSYWFYASEAYGINDLGQVVGSLFDDFNKAFVYGGGQNINLHNLLGGDEVQDSVALDINNKGQIIGSYSTRGSTYTAFVYNNGGIKTLGGSLIDINNNGIAVGSSGATAILYDIDNDTSINFNLDSIIDSEEAIWLSSARGINDKGQIAATGYFKSDVKRINNAFLLNPRFAEPILDDYINIGNISTFGDTVLLQGNEITLTGEAIATNGGKITLDGATTVNGNLTIDSSVIENEVITGGGDITFTKTLDAASAATGNLRLQAGTGNIVFGDIVGGEATFNNINILGAKTVTANGDITSSGLIKINATEDINAQNITSETGNIKLTSEEKSITALDITSGNEGGNIVLEGVEGVYTANLNAHKLGVVKIKSGDVLEDNTVVIDDTP